MATWEALLAEVLGEEVPELLPWVRELVEWAGRIGRDMNGRQLLSERKVMFEEVGISDPSQRERLHRLLDAWEAGRAEGLESTRPKALKGKR